MLGQSAIGAAALGAAGRTGATPAPPPLDYRAQASQMVAVVPASGITSGEVNGIAIVVPSADVAVPTAGANVAQFAIVSVGTEYMVKPQTHGYSIKTLWAFPLMIQEGF